MPTRWIAFTASYERDRAYERRQLFPLLCAQFDQWQANHPSAQLLSVAQQYVGPDIVGTWAALFVIYQESETEANRAEWKEKGA